MSQSQCSAQRLKSIEKYKDDLSRVKLSDITYPLVMSGFFSKEDLSDILANPTNDQMKALLKVLEGLLGKLPAAKQEEVWECFVWALHNDYSQLALNLALFSGRTGPGKKSLPKITKEDIGLPCDFKHLVSFTGGSKTADVNLSDLEPKLEPGSPLSPFEGTPFFPSAAST